MTVDRTKGVQPGTEKGVPGSSAHCRGGIGRQGEEGVPSRLFVCPQSNTRRPLERPRRCDSPPSSPTTDCETSSPPGREPVSVCIDSPHGPSVSSRASPDDPRFDPRPASARCDLEGRSSAGSSLDPLASPDAGTTLCHRFHAFSRSLVHLSTREGLFRPEAPPRPEMRPPGTPTGAANA